MNKKSMVERVRQLTGLDVQKTERVLDATLGSIRDELRNGGEVALKGFGTFKVVERAARAGRNPKTGEAIQIPASRGVKFTPSGKLKEMVNS